ncbi:MAG TPA: LuxR C-terminal-related transcriptional regulator [Streptomyces sp.]|nr:LuxR C-terminal-related transcriptional regulator [Streptomyces sp.]
MAEIDDDARGSALAHTDAPGDPFLRTRFALPSRPATFLRRPRLVRHLDQALTTPLTLVNGAAGAGKTLLAADWADGLREPVAWLTVEAGDARPGVFWAYVLEALRGCGVRAAATAGAPADPSRAGRAPLAPLAAELNARDRPVVLVLDEYDRLPDPGIAEELEFVLHHAGRGLRLVLVSRTEPPLPLHRHRAAGELTEIRGAELALTPAEAGVLLELHGLRLPAPAAHALVERTRGWAAGVRLSALAARESDDPERYLKEFEAGHSTVADFLLAEVLKGKTPEARDLLLRVSVLDRFCPALADALTLRSDAGPLLAGLHRENAFIERLGHSWYRLHPLFREILRVHLRERMPGAEPELHLRAARWLRRSGFLPETLAHGAAGGDWDLAADALVDDLAIGQLFTGLHAHHLAQLFARLGPEARSPASDLVRAARALARHDVEHGLARLRRAEEQLPDDAPGPEPARVSCALLEALAARLTGCPPRAEQAAALAGELLVDLPGPLLDRHPELTALLWTHVGSARVWEGRFDDARAVLAPVAGAPGGNATVLPRAEALGHLALLDYLDGWPGRAERDALAAVAEEERAGPDLPPGAGIGRLVLAAVAVDRQELDRARALLDRAAPQPARVPDPVPAAGRALATSRLLLDSGRAAAAAEAAEPAVAAAVASPWAQGHTALVVAAAHLAGGRPDEASRALDAIGAGPPVCAVEAAALQFAAGRPRAAAGLLATARAQAGGRGRAAPAVRVGAALVEARAAQESGDPDAARGLVGRALADARRERLRRPFLRAGDWIEPLLATAPLRDLAAGWLVTGPPPRRAARPRPPGPAPAPEPLVPVELSGRELDVLRRLARLMSTEEIAADLYVSANTVKTHLKSAYRKLAVNRRGDAVRRARELGLL